VTITVVVPWRGGCEHRERAWGWVSSRYAQQHPQWDVVLAGAPSGAWSKARAVMPAVRHLADELVVVADADVWCAELEPAVAAVQAGAMWAMPHRQVIRLTETATAQLHAGLAEPWDLPAEQRYVGVHGGGIVIASRDVLLEVPLDPRFEGWGQEDQSWALALATLAGGCWRGTVPLAHLWHPPQQRASRARGSAANVALWTRYVAARGRPERMRELLDEVSW
jgi:hypothetical protein